MVLILSSPGDLSTELVMDWLRNYQHPFLKINSQDFLEKAISFSLFPAELTIDGKPFDIDAVGAVWYRKFGFFGRSPYYQKNKKKLSPGAANQLKQEFQTITQGFTSLFHDKYWLTQPHSVTPNKLVVLNLAKQCGLLIPTTHIVNTREQLQKKLAQHSLITKSAYEPFFMQDPKGMYSMYTKEVTPEIANEFGATFFPSLLQEKVEKAYELRIFYLEGVCYSMAIFSQQDEQTAIDFRMYDHESPTRSVPYVLPEIIRHQLQQLMEKMDLNCGSIDMIRATNGNYYFLEVNPVGQFGMTSIPCNYDLHEVVASHLIKKDLEYEKVPA